MRIETQETPPAENTEEGPWEHLLASSLGCLASASSTVAVQLSVGHEPHTQHGVDSLSSEMPSNDSNETWINPNPHPFFRYRHTLFGSRRLRRRIILKNGECNVVQGKVAKRRRRYLKDIFTTLVDAQWRWTLLVFALNFVLSWLSFAFVWWIIVITHGDLNPRNNPTLARLNNYTGEMNEEWQPCVTGINGFVSCFLFSVETQHTIGYGSRSTTEECPEAIFVMCLQSICGVMIQAFMVGVVFAKLSRPKKRTQTLLFSRNAVICLRNGELCLMFRVGDMRKSHIVEAHVRAQYISRKVTCEGELLSFHQQEMLVGGDGREDRLFFIWPTTIVHRIDAHSPLYTLRPQELPRSRFEIVVLLEGVVESTGMTTQARSSYLPSEILWGRRFEPLIEFRRDTGQYSVDFSQFDATYKVETPECSAKEIEMTGLQGKLIIPDGLDTSPTSNTESTSLSSHAPFTIQE